MSLLDDLQNQWPANDQAAAALPSYDRSALDAITRKRANQQISRAMRYFWSALTHQIIVYALLSHVWVRSWGDANQQWLCLAGILLYLPFTIMLLKKYKQVAQPRPSLQAPNNSVQQRLRHQYLTLLSFYRFKRHYEYVLIPASTGLGIFLLLGSYVPGHLQQNMTLAVSLYALTLVACIWAIRRENRNLFDKPIQALRHLLNEFDQ